MSATATPPRSPLDSYLEFEVYLSRTQKEIGDAFDELVYGDSGGRRTPLATSKIANSSSISSPIAVHGASRSRPPYSPASSAPSLDRGAAVAKHACRLCSGVAASNYSGDAGSEMSSSVPSTRTASPVELRTKNQDPPPVPQRAASLWLDPRLLSKRRGGLEARRSLSTPPASDAGFRPPSPPLRNRRRRYVADDENNENSASALGGRCWHHARRTSCPSPPPELLKLTGPLLRDEPFVREVLEQIELPRTRGSRSRRDFWDNRNAVTVSIPPGENLLHWCPQCCTFLQHVNPNAALWDRGDEPLKKKSASKDSGTKHCRSEDYSFKNAAVSALSDGEARCRTFPFADKPCRSEDHGTRGFESAVGRAFSGSETKCNTFPFTDKPRRGGFYSTDKSVLSEPRPTTNGSCSGSHSAFSRLMVADAPIDVNELSAFVDSLVDEVNSFDPDGDPESAERDNLNKFAACFPKAEKRIFPPLLIRPATVAAACENLKSPEVPAGETTPLVDDVFEDDASGEAASCFKNGSVVIPRFPDNYSIFDRRQALNQSGCERKGSASSIPPDKKSSLTRGLSSDKRSETLDNGTRHNGDVSDVGKPLKEVTELRTGLSSCEIAEKIHLKEDAIEVKDSGSASMVTNGDTILSCNGKSEINGRLGSLADDCGGQVVSIADEPLLTSSPIAEEDVGQSAVCPSSIPAEFQVVRQNQKSRDLGEFMRLLETSIRETSGTPILDGDQESVESGKTLSTSSSVRGQVSVHGVADAITQTSPSTSRACSWLSDCNCPDGNCDHRRHSLVWGATSSSGDLMQDDSINEMLSTLGSTTCSSVDELGRIVPSRHHHQDSLTSSCDLLESLGDSTADDSDSFSSASSTLGSDDSSPGPVESLEENPVRSPEFPPGARTGGSEIVWVKRNSFQGPRLPSVSEHEGAEVAAKDFERRHLDPCLDSKITAPRSKQCRLVSQNEDSVFENKNQVLDSGIITPRLESEITAPGLESGMTAQGLESEITAPRCNQCESSVARSEDTNNMCRSASTPPHTLPHSSKSSKRSGAEANMSRLRIEMSESQPEGLCRQGDPRFGTVPLSKPKHHLMLNVSASGVSHSSPGFATPADDRSSGTLGEVTAAADDSSRDSREEPVSPWAQPHLLDYNKSSSAPILGERDHRADGLRKVFLRRGCGAEDSSAESEDAGKTFAPPRSQSAKELSELEAVEACKWLRATGFPQYAQMFEDQQFPIDVSSVHKDHDFLDNDSIQSLFRRLNALNRCARMRLDNLPRKISGDDSDEENQCALSENWEFQRQSRRWSRIPGNFEAALAKHGGGTGKEDWDENVDEEEEEEPQPEGDHSGSSNEDEAQKQHPTHRGGDESSMPPSVDKVEGGGTGTGSGLKRSGSERLKDGAKAFMRRVESIKSRRSKRKNRNAVVISGPQLLDVPAEGDLACVQITPPDTAAQPMSPTGGSSSPSPNSPSDTSPRCGQDSNQGRKFFGNALHYGRDGEPCALSDSECSPTLWRSSPASPTGRSYMDNYLAPDSPRLLAVNCADAGDGINYRTGSFNLGVESGAYRERFHEGQRTKRASTAGAGPERYRRSIYDNVPVVIFNKGYTDENGQPLQEEDIFKNITSLNTAFAKSADQRSTEGTLINERASSTTDSASIGSAILDVSDQDNRSIHHQQWERRDSGVGLSLTRSDRSQPKWQTSSYCHRPSIPCRTVPLNELTSGQIMVIRKLALLKLTALMERYSPSNRSGWNWAMPKFIKRMKTPDYKDKTVFGVPLVVVLQRTGNPIPGPIQEAIRFIRKNAIDSVGIFRKSGVRSRIQKLKNGTESNSGAMNYDEQQPYDVADMVKQYFRELPEALLTNKMSETFIGIYQHIEEDVRQEALQAAVVLMPDENREVLQALLTFLNDVSCRAEENQMTASNLAVCFAPSLFHMSSPRSQSTSPRRRKTVGVPDQRELNENRAAHECLTHMIRDFNSLFSIPDDILAQCRCPYMEQWRPPTMEELLQKTGNNDWRASMENGIQWLLKESREKFKGWVSVSTTDNTELAFKKMGDGNPLRVWKAAVEVEAPPSELLVRILKERHVWDSTMLKWRVIDKLDKQTEVFQYVCSSMTPLPARDYCVLRSWKTDLPKGTCVLVESSVDHPEAATLLGGVRGVVLDSKYLIEPCGSGKSRVTHVSRVDTRGRSPDWYNKAYGQMCSLYLSRLRDSLQHAADGPESKV